MNSEKKLNNHRYSEGLGHYPPNGRGKSPLKKMGKSLVGSEVFRSKKSEASSLLEKKKKVAIKFKL